MKWSLSCNGAQWWWGYWSFSLCSPEDLQVLEAFSSVFWFWLSLNGSHQSRFVTIALSNTNWILSCDWLFLKCGMYIFAWEWHKFICDWRSRVDETILMWKMSETARKSHEICFLTSEIFNNRKKYVTVEVNIFTINSPFHQHMNITTFAFYIFTFESHHSSTF